MSVPTGSDVQVFVVRQQADRPDGREQYAVVHLPTGKQVYYSCDGTSASAQLRADSLNILKLVKPWFADPRPFEERHAEAAQRYREAMGR